MAKAEPSIGDQLNASGKADLVIQDYGTSVLNYTSTSKITGTEIITVPFGTFTTLKLVFTLRIYGTAAGQVIDETAVITYWLAPGIGPVKADEGPPDYLVYELVDSNLPDLIPCIIVGGTAGDDMLQGTPAKDCINGKAGDDTMYGLGEDDVYTVQNSGDVVIEGAGEGTDTIKSAVTYTLPIYVEKLRLTGAANINGTGNGLANVITGNTGSNLLNGGPGNDTLRGYAGQDRFLFKTTLGSGNIDKITDFTPADDTIRLENAVFTALGTTGTLASAAFKVGTAASTAAHRIIYDPATGGIFYDPDGSGAAPKVGFATLTTKPTLTNADFFVQ
jgi:Ca2+-binding RTX toxin-like protein